MARSALCLEPVSEHFHEEVVFRGFAVQEDVLGGSEPGDEREFLVDVTDAGFECIEGVGKVHFFAFQEDFPFEAARLADDRHSEKDVHEGALARAVLSDQTEDLSFLEGERHVSQDAVSEIFLADVLHSQKRHCFHCLRITSLNPGKKAQGDFFPLFLRQLFYDTTKTLKRPDIPEPGRRKSYSNRPGLSNLSQSERNLIYHAYITTSIDEPGPGTRPRLPRPIQNDIY